MAVFINYEDRDRTPAQFVTELAEKIYKSQGYTLKFNTWQETATYFLNSQHSREKEALHLAEDIYLSLAGDSVDWNDLDEE
jgi:hypothetical protein